MWLVWVLRVLAGALALGTAILTVQDVSKAIGAGIWPGFVFASEVPGVAVVLGMLAVAEALSLLCQIRNTLRLRA